MSAAHADLMRALYRHTTSAVIAANLDRELTAMNAAAERMFGYSEPDILGKKSEILYADPRDYGRLGLSHYGSQAEGLDTPKPYLVRYRTRNGRIFDGETVGCPVEDENGKRIGLLCIITDVTNRLAMQAKLEASDIQLRAALASANEGAFSLNLATGLGSTRGFINEFLGIASADATISLDRWTQVIQEEDRASFRKAIDRIRISPGLPLDVTYRATRADGQDRWLHTRGKVSEYGPDGSAHRITGVISDVTERQNLELELARREKQLDSAINAGSCGVWEVDARTLAVTPIGEIREMLGVPDEPQTIDGRLWLERTHPDERQNVADQLRALAAGKTDELDAIYRLLDCRTDEYRWIHSRGGMVKEAGTKRIAAGVLLDITSEMQLRAKLEESERRISQAVDAGLHGVWEMNFALDEMEITGRINSVFGHPRTTANYKVETWLASVADHDRDRVRKEIDELSMQGEQNRYFSTFRMLTQGGEIVWVDVSGAVTSVDDSGRATQAVGLVTDVTERKSLEHQVGSSQRLLRNALGAANEGAWRLDLKTQVTEVTGILSRMIGLGESDALTTYEEWAVRIHPEDRSIADRASRAFMEGKQDTVDYIVRYNSAADGWVRVHNRGRVIEWDAQGRPAIAIGAMTDITASFDTSELLAERENQVEDAIQTGALCLWRYDRSTEQMWMRGTFDRLFAEPKPEIVIPVEQWMDRIHEEDRAQLESSREIPNDKGEDAATMSYRIRTLDDEWMWVRTSGRVIERYPDGKVRITSGVVIDVDEIHRARELASAERLRFEQIYQSTPAMMHTISADGDITQVSDYWLSYFGYERDEVIGRKSLDFLDDESRERAITHTLPELFETGHQSNIPYRFKRKDGRTVDVLLSSFLERDQHGKPLRSFAVMTDVTPLRTAYEQLERSNTELDRFATVASHDLQEPLRKISAFAGLIRRRYIDKLDEEGIRSLEFLVDAAERMQTLIDDLLRYSRMASQPLRLERIDLNDIIAEVRELLAGAIEENSAELDIDDLPVVRGDPTLLKQALANLIGNAIKYRRDINPVIKVRAERLGERVRISIQDNGIGLDPKFADKIFAPFQRLHSRADYKGTGIGLAIVRQAIQRHGGTVEVESEPGVGSTFTIDIPRPVGFQGMDDA
ncbi:MAG: PAS domain-containing protein [Maricaulis sp.]|uniref:PAS domain-containing sensor histidine kinase n=1 Tax=Maricaulis sp. TaxID=1486257 RepID=UPI001B295CB6|nr:PAS domain-containing protein [Maricaulis sp.]MBO6728223.1 PAS domain-containing protein [Maricaulis sp.]MBO6846768.1 PAS domain-containing protein [Maricaulis sp.]MBO6877871.1 PAS domain-containing protein [Maricaulis sp.]